MAGAADDAQGGLPGRGPAWAHRDLEPTPSRRWREAWSGRPLDWALAVVLLAPAVAVGFTHGDQSSGGPIRLPVLAIVLAVAATLGLGVRDRHPVGCLSGIVVVSTVVEIALDGPSWFMTFQFLIAAYSVAVRLPRREAIIGIGAAVSVLVVADNISRGLVLGDSVSRIGISAAATALGLYVGARRAYIGALRERAARLEKERELLSAQAVADERLRIARELHDVVAHHVSLLVVQAGAVRETLPSDHRARPVLDSMADTGRQALGEMRRMLGVLRVGEGQAAAEMTPQPGADDIQALVDQIRATGCRVDLRVVGEPRRLPLGVDLSAYRIVQEALTNVVRHAGQVAVEVELRYEADGLRLSVVDHGAEAPRPATDGSGHGLVGMRERTALFGGELQTGPVVGGGFAVRARLPIDLDPRTP